MGHYFSELPQGIRRRLGGRPERSVISSRDIARAARVIWKYEAAEGRQTIRAVQAELKIPHENSRR